MKKRGSLSIRLDIAWTTTTFLVLLAIILYPGSVYAGTEIEPNDKLGLANEVFAGEPITGTFGFRGDHDWYKITLTTPGRLRCSVTDPPADIRARIRLYNRHADYLYVHNSAVNQGDDVHVTYDVVDPGTYYVRLNERDNNTSDHTYTFTADFTPVVDPHEPNNEPGRATLMTEGIMNGFIFDRSDHDWYKIYVDADSTLSVEADPPGEMRPRLRLYNPDMGYTWVSSQAVNPGDKITLEYQAQVSGFYYVRVNDAEGRAHMEPYTLTVTGGRPGFVPPFVPVTSEEEPNDTLGAANPIELGASVTGAIGEQGDRDWFRFSVPAPGRLTASLDASPADLHLRLRLYGSSGNHIVTGQPTAMGGTFSLVHDVREPDTFFLLVEDLDTNRYSEGVYRFSTSLLEVDDPFEPNDDFGDAALVDNINRVTAYVFPRGDHDWYRIRVSDTSEPLRVIISDLPENIAPHVAIYNNSKESLTSRSGVAGMDMELAYSLPAPGDYFVQMRATSSSVTSVSPYTMTLFGADFEAFAPTAHIERIEPGSVVFGETISFTGSGYDSDGEITAYSWRSGIDGEISTDAQFSTSDLSIGTHTIYFKVRDDDGIWSTEVSRVVYVGSSVSEEEEPNDVIGRTNEIAFDPPVRAKMDERRDLDFFKVFVSRPGRLTWEVENVPKNLRLNLRCYNRHLAYTYISGSAAQEGDSVSVSMDITEPGFYYLRVNDRDSDFNADFTYTLTVSLAEAVDSYEPNDGMLDAHTMTQDTVQGYLFPRGDHDWFRVWVDAGETLKVNLSDTPSDLRPRVRLYDRNRNYLWVSSQSENQGDDPPPVSRTFEEDGLVYIRVNERDNNFNTSDMYTLTVTGANPGWSPHETPVSAEEEPNNVIADANLIAPEMAVQGFMDTPSDEDWFKFRMPAAGIIHVSVDPVPDSMRGRVRVYRDDASMINSRDATNPGDPLNLDTRVTRPGWYYVRMDDLNRGAPADPYRLLVSVTPVVDVHEPNDALGDATPLEDQNRTQAMIFDQGDEDWYRVIGEAGETLEVTIADVPPEIVAQVDIYDGSGSRLTGATATNYGQNLRVSRDLAEDGFYYFRVRHAGNNSFSTEPYTVIVTGAVFNSYTPLAFIESMEPNPAGAGETVAFEGRGEDPDGEIIGYSWRSSLDGEISVSRVATVDEPSSGTHTIYFRVMDNDGNWSPEARALLYYGVPAPAEEEPNDTIGQADFMELDTVYSGKMDRAGDHDYFRVRVDVPGRLTVSAVNPTGSDPMRIQLRGYTLDADYSYNNVTANADLDPVTLTWDLSEPGDYFIRVHDHGGRAGGVYTIEAALQAAPDPFEPNDEAGLAKPLDTDDVVQAYVFPRGDLDWYRVDAPVPGTLEVSLTDMPGNLRGVIRIYDSNIDYTWVNEQANNVGDDVFLTYNVARPGSYYVRIHDRDSSVNPSQTYTLSTSFAPAVDANEPNDALGPATPVTKSYIEAYMFPRGDEDWYRIRAEAGASLEVSTDSVPENLRLFFRLYGPDTNYLNVNERADTEGESVTLSYDVPATGFYYLRVTDRDNDWSSESPYRLLFSGADLAPPPADEPVTEATGGNRSFGSADPIAAPGVAGTLEAKDREHWFRFEVGEASLLTLSLEVPSNIRSVIDIYDASGARRARRTAQNAGDFSWMYFLIDTPGTWYVAVYAADSGAVSTDPFQLNLSLEPAMDPFEPNDDFASARPLMIGEPIQATIFPAGDQDWFRLEPDVPGMIRFELEGIPEEIAICLDVYNLNNSRVLRKESLNAGRPLTATFFAAEAGTYFVRVYDRTNNAASVDPYTLTAFLMPFEDPFEPNDRFSEATELFEKNQVSALIYPAGDVDWYTFTVSRPGTLSIQVAEAEGIEPHIQIYSSSKSSLAWKAANNRGDDLLMTYEVTEPDRYYVVIRDDGNNDYSLRPYVLTILGGDFEEYYPMASIDSIGPNPAVFGDPVAMTGSGSFDEGEASGFEWKSDLDGPLGGSAELSASNLSMGTHVIGFRVKEGEDKWSSRVGKRLHVTDRVLLEREPNDSIDQADPVPLSTWITGRIAPTRDEDYYKIYVDTPGYLSVLMEAVPRNMRGQVRFYDYDGSYLYRNDSAPNDGDWFHYGFFTDPGWYYVRVTDRDNRAHQDTYGVLFDLAPALDLNEPNDSPGEAVLVPLDGKVEDAFIYRPKDQDWYRLDVPCQGRLSLSITGAPPEMRGQIRVYDSNAAYTYENNAAINEGEDVFLDYDVSAPGSYYIRIIDRDNRAHTEPYTFTAAFTPVEDQYEPNGGIARATLMPESSSVSAHIFPRSDEDWYTIYASEGEELLLSVTDAPEGMRTDVRVYDRNTSYTWVRETANNDGDSVYLQYGVPADGFYYIRINDHNNAAHVTPYTFTVMGGAPGCEPDFSPVTAEVEPNNDLGLANDIALDTDVTGTIDPGDDNDWYRFHVNSPGIVTISHTGIAEEIRSEMWVYDGGKTQVGYRLTTNKGDGNVLILTVDRGGYYFVRVRDRSSTGSSNPYTLTVEHMPVVDVNEPNDNYGTATPLGQDTVQGYIFPSGDHDWYRVFVRDPGALSLSLDLVPEDLRPELGLYDADNDRKVTWVSTNPGVGGEDVITFDVSRPGFYYVSVRSASFDDSDLEVEHKGYSADPYTLRITGADSSTAPILTPVGDRVIHEGVPYGFTVYATDPDNPEDLVFSAQNLPPGAEFDPETRTFSWTPAAGQAGTYPGVRFVVGDGTSTDREDITITVLGPDVALPLVVTGSVTRIRDTSAVVSGEVTSGGGAAVTQRGVVYATHEAPTLDDAKVEADSAGTGAFSVTISGLDPETAYYARAYAMNSEGAGYGEPVMFTTESLILKGDLNNDGKVDLADAIMALKAVAGKDPGDVYMAAEVDGDGRITSVEAIYILQVASEVRNP